MCTLGLGLKKDDKVTKNAHKPSPSRRKGTLTKHAKCVRDARAHLRVMHIKILII